MQAEQAIRRVQRAVALTWVIHIVLAGLIIFLMTAGPTMGIPTSLMLVIPCMLWVLLAFNGMRETRAISQWPNLIASGQLEEAERQIEASIGRFTLLRSVKLVSLHQLSVLRMAQGNWRDAMELSKATLTYRHGSDGSLLRASLLVMGGSAVRSGAADEAYQAIARLRGMALSLDEQLTLLSIECAYLARIQAWEELFRRVSEKARLAELMPGEASAQTQAYLALAARRQGRQDWEFYLANRSTLLMSQSKLIAEDETFRELWPGATL